MDPRYSSNSIAVSSDALSEKLLEGMGETSKLLSMAYSNLTDLEARLFGGATADGNDRPETVPSGTAERLNRSSAHLSDLASELMAISSRLAGRI